MPRMKAAKRLELDSLKRRILTDVREMDAYILGKRPGVARLFTALQVRSSLHG